MPRREYVWTLKIAGGDRERQKECCDYLGNTTRLRLRIGRIQSIFSTIQNADMWLFLIIARYFRSRQSQGRGDAERHRRVEKDWCPCRLNAIHVEDSTITQCRQKEESSLETLKKTYLSILSNSIPLFSCSLSFSYISILEAKWVMTMTNDDGQGMDWCRGVVWCGVDRARRWKGI